MSFNIHTHMHTHTHTQTILEPPPEDNHRRVRADSHTADGLRPPSPISTPTPQGKDCLLCSGLPASVLGDVLAPALHGLTSASLTDPVLQALLQGSSKSRVTLFCRRLGTESTSSQRDLCNPRVHGGQPGSSLRVERLTCQMKTGSGS